MSMISGKQVAADKMRIPSQRECWLVLGFDADHREWNRAGLAIVRSSLEEARGYGEYQMEQRDWLAYRIIHVPGE